MKFILKSIIAILFISNFSFAQIASLDLSVASTGKTGSTWMTSMDEKDKKPNVDNAATHSNPVISGIKNRLVQNLNDTDLMVKNGMEGVVPVEIRISETGEIKPTIVKSLLEKLDQSVLSAIDQMPPFDFSGNGY